MPNSKTIGIIRVFQSVIILILIYYSVIIAELSILNGGFETNDFTGLIVEFLDAHGYSTFLLLTVGFSGLIAILKKVKKIDPTVSRLNLFFMVNRKRISCCLLLLLFIGICNPAFSDYTTQFQSHYRWRNDNGNETTATFAAPEDTILNNLIKGSSKRLRLGMLTTSSEFIRKKALTMNFPEDYIDCGVIDTMNGYAYFGTNTAPGEIIKVRLSDFTKVDAISLADYSNPGEYFLTSAVIDPIEGYAYFGNSYGTKGLIFKIDIDPSRTFQRVGTLILDSGENALKTAIIDTSGSTHYAYFGTYTSPGKVIKVNLTTFTKESTLIFNAGENAIATSVIDAGNGFAYFGLNTVNPAKIVKVDINPGNTFSKISTLNVSTTAGFLSSVIDTTGYAYFGEGQYWSKVVRIRLSDFTLDESLSLAANIDGKLTTAVIDSSGATHYAYFVGNRSSGGARVVKVNLTSNSRVQGQLT